jgi:hypothetical protein
MDSKPSRGSRRHAARLYTEEGNLGKLGRGVLLLVAEDERDRTKAGFLAAQAHAIDNGIYIAARTPFGYVRDDERESPTYRRLSGGDR